MKIRSLLFVSALAVLAIAVLRCGNPPEAGLDAATPSDAEATVADTGPEIPPDAAAPLCDPAKCNPGNICVQDRCMLPCARHTNCPNGYDCRAIEGHLVCVANGLPHGTGEFGTACGLDPSICAPGFRCIGRQDSPTAYCTRAPCANGDAGADMQCPGNYYCATIDVAAPRDAGVADTGPKHDGSIAVPNSMPAQFCLKRNFCAPAASLTDCNDPQAIFGTDSRNNGWCLKSCSGIDPNGCGGGNGCFKMDGGFQCWPRFMTCAPNHQFCSRCTSSLDCPAKSYCTDTGTGEPYCTRPCWLDTDCTWKNMPNGGNQGTCMIFDNGEHQCIASGATSDYGAPTSCWKPLPWDGGVQ